MRITDTDDDFAVTTPAQRAAILELDNLTWNYPAPRLQNHSHLQGDEDDEDEDEDEDDDDDDSYYMDAPPYDMTARLKEVNRALAEDVTPVECDRVITIRFRDVIAEYQSPRELTCPSDSDDGYGDSSDLLYDVEDDDILTSTLDESPFLKADILALKDDLHFPKDGNNEGEDILDELRQLKQRNQEDIEKNVPRLQLQTKGDSRWADGSALHSDLENEFRSGNQVKPKSCLSFKRSNPLQDQEMLDVNSPNPADLSFIKTSTPHEVNLDVSSLESVQEEYGSLSPLSDKISSPSQISCNKSPLSSLLPSGNKSVPSSLSPTSSSPLLPSSLSSSSPSSAASSASSSLSPTVCSASSYAESALCLHDNTKSLSSLSANTTAFLPQEEESSRSLHKGKQTTQEREKEEKTTQEEKEENKDKESEDEDKALTEEEEEKKNDCSASSKTQDVADLTNDNPTSFPVESEEKTSRTLTEQGTESSKHYFENLLANEVTIEGYHEETDHDDEDVVIPEKISRSSKTLSANSELPQVDVAETSSSAIQLSETRKEKEWEEKLSGAHCVDGKLTQKEEKLKQNNDALQKVPSSTKFEQRSESASPSHTMKVRSPTRKETSSSVPKSQITPAAPVIKQALFISDRLTSRLKTDSSRPKIKSGSKSPTLANNSTITNTLQKQRDTVSSSGKKKVPMSTPVQPTLHNMNAVVTSKKNKSGGKNSIPKTGGRLLSRYTSPTRPPSGRSTAMSNSESSRGSSSVNSSSSFRRSSPGSPYMPSSNKQHSYSQPRTVRKAASVSDLHRPSGGEGGEDRSRRNESVFEAWLQQKNKQQRQRSRRKPPTEEAPSEAERRRLADEAFEAWVVKKRQQLRLEKRLSHERRRLEEQGRYSRTQAECDTAYKEWCRRKREEVRSRAASGRSLPRSQSLERPWAQEKTLQLYSAYLTGH